MRRLWDRLRARWLSLTLYVGGHHRASRMARGWQPGTLSREEMAHARANLIRRYPGR